jgi:hypothetical protein
VGVFHRGRGSFYRAEGGCRGGEGGVTASDAVAFNGRVISGSSRWVKAQLEGGGGVTAKE